jgi:hypothetical protein
MVTLQQLKNLMQKYAGDISGGRVSRTVPLEQYLPDDGIGTATSRRIFKSSVIYTLYVNNVRIKPWPNNWVSVSIDGLAPKLL